MKKTRITDLLNISLPILQGGMLWLADANLAAAVSNAGALGVISPMAGMQPHGDPVANLKLQIEKIHGLTDKPFGVNIPLDLRSVETVMESVFSRNVPVVITAAGDPRQYTEFIKASGSRIVHVISCVKQALVAEEAGVDAVIASGVEAAARNGFDEIPAFSLIPQVADAVKIPVIAAGGIADSRGMAAAFVLGAEGVQLGTRFVAVKENIASQNYKDAIVAAGDSDTIVTNRPFVPSRSLKSTAYTKALLDLERSGASAETISDYLGYAPSRRGGLEGNLDKGEAFCGSSAGLINDIVETKEVIRRLVEGYGTAKSKL